MKRNCLLFLLITAFITCSAGILWATPILNQDDDGEEDRSDGTAFAYYQNSGLFMFIGDYNNEGNNLGQLQTDVIGWLAPRGYDTTNFTLVDYCNP